MLRPANRSKKSKLRRENPGLHSGGAGVPGNSLGYNRKPAAGTAALRSAGTCPERSRRVLPAFFGP